MPVGLRAAWRLMGASSVLGPVPYSSLSWVSASCQSSSLPSVLAEKLRQLSRLVHNCPRSPLMRWSAACSSRVEGRRWSAGGSSPCNLFDRAPSLQPRMTLFGPPVYRGAGYICADYPSSQACSCIHTTDHAFSSTHGQLAANYIEVAASRLSSIRPRPRSWYANPEARLFVSKLSQGGYPRKSQPGPESSTGVLGREPGAPVCGSGA